jgi:CheY-like chemotaxis protein
VPTTLLAVDDSVTMRKVLELTFAGEDFRVVTAEGADVAFAKIRAEHPAVVLCDVTLDGAGGYALCTKIKAENPSIAVVMLASKQQPYDSAKGQAAKADDFVEKPFDTQQLIEKVKRLATRPSTEDAPTRAAVSQVSAAGPPAAAAPLPARPAASSGAATAPLGVSRPSAPGTANPRPPAPSIGSAGGIGRGTLAYGGAGFPGMPNPSGAPVPATATAPGPGSPARPPLPSSPTQGASAAAAAPAPVAAAAVTSQVASPGSAVGPSAAQPAVAAPPAAAASVARPPAPAVPPLAAPAAAPPGLAATAANSPLAGKLATLGLTDVQVAAVLALSREVVERVVWEVVPVLAETMIKEEIARLTENA